MTSWTSASAGRKESSKGHSPRIRKTYLSFRGKMGTKQSSSNTCDSQIINATDLPSFGEDEFSELLQNHPRFFELRNSEMKFLRNCEEIGNPLPESKKTLHLDLAHALEETSIPKIVDCIKDCISRNSDDSVEDVWISERAAVYLDFLTDTLTSSSQEDMAVIMEALNFVRDVLEKYQRIDWIRQVSDVITDCPPRFGSYKLERGKGRRLIKQGRLLFERGLEGKTKKKLDIFLCNDLIMYADRIGGDQSKERLSFQGVLWLKGAVVMTRSQRFSYHPAMKGKKPFFWTMDKKGARRGPASGTSNPSRAKDLKNSIQISAGHELYTLSATTFEIRNEWLTAISTAVAECNQSRVFGEPLLNIVEREKAWTKEEGVPCLLSQLMHFFEGNLSRLRTEGIFRVSPPLVQLEILSDSIDSQTSGESPCFPNESDDAHIAAAMMKQFLRLLPQSLVPSHLQSVLHDAVKNDSQGFEGKGFPEIKNILDQFPELNRRVLTRLISFLSKVKDESEHNKMESRNLGIIFEPILFRKETEGRPKSTMDLDTMFNSVALTSTPVERLIDHFVEIFGENAL